MAFGEVWTAPWLCPDQAVDMQEQPLQSIYSYWPMGLRDSLDVF